MTQKTTLTIVLSLCCVFIAQAQTSLEEPENTLSILFTENRMEELSALIRQLEEEAKTTKNDTLRAYSMGQKARKLQREGNYELAEQTIENAISLFEPFSKQYELQYANMLSCKAMILEMRGEYAQAEKLLKQVLEIKLRKIGKKGTEYTITLNGLAVIYEATGRYKEAEENYLQALAILKADTNKDVDKNETYSGIIGNLALLYWNKGQYEKAEPLYNDLLALDADFFGKDHPYYALDLNNLGILYWEMGRYEESEAVFLQAIEINAAAVGKTHPDYANNLSNLAVLYNDMGLYEQAENLYVEAISINADALGKEHPNYATNLNNLAALYKSIKQYAKAEQLYTETLKIQAKTLGEEHLDYITTLFNIASLYEQTQRFGEAEATYQKALLLRGNLSGKDHPDYAYGLNNLAIVYRQKGDYAQAEKFHLQAKDIREKVLGKKHPHYANSLNDLAILYLAWQRLDTAMAYCVQGIAANCQQKDQIVPEHENWDSLSFFSNDHIIKAVATLANISKAMYQKQTNAENLQQLYTINKLAMRMNERIKNDFSGEGNKLRLLKENNQFVTEGISAALALATPQYLAEAFEFAEQNKSILLADALKGNRARDLGDLPDSLVLQEIALKERYDQLKKDESEANTKADREAIAAEQNELNLELEAFRKEIKDKYPRYHALKYEQITAKAADIQNIIDESTLFLEYFVSNESVFLFAIEKNNLQVLKFPLSVDTLAAKIAALRNALTNYQQINTESEKNYEIYTESAFWLYQQLVAPALNTQKNKTTKLIIVADGELGHLPFETFLMEAAPQQFQGYAALHYLVKYFSISYNYSATLWKENLQTDERKNNGQMFALAASYDLKSQQEGLRPLHLQQLRKSLAALPSALSEVKTLSQQFKGKFNIGNEANEQTFKQQAPQYSIIHLAMHGLMNRRQPILSSLAFTENNDSTEDNFLEAWEIAKLKLNADLVVLSACETGYGKFEQGEGVLSLARAFMYTGVPALVVSMWEVNDASTAQIMQTFYQNLSNGQDKAEALRQAKLQYLSEARGTAAHPAYWSAFVQVGDSRPIAAQQRGGSKIWFWALAVGGGAAILLFMRKLRKA